MKSDKVLIGIGGGLLIILLALIGVAFRRDVRVPTYANIGFFQFDEFKNLDEDYLEKVPVRLAITWSLFEQKPEKFDFDNKQAKKIDEYLKNGYAVIPAIRAKSKWAVVKPIAGDEKGESGENDSGEPAGTDDQCASAPFDMDHQKPLTEGESYSETYYRFVQKLAEHYKGKFPIVVIENEINDPIPEGGDWCGTVDEYIRLVLTAKKAFHDVDPTVRIADGALQPRPLMWLVIDEYLRASQVDEATRLYQLIEQETLTLDQLEQKRNEAFREPRITRAQEFIDADLHQWLDIANFHYLHHPNGLEDIVSYLRRHMPDGKPLMTTAYGRSNRYVTGDAEAAKEIVRGGAHLLALNVSPAILMTRPGGNDRVTTAMTDTDGNLKMLNKNALEATARFLGNVEPSSAVDLSDEDTREYKFRSPTGFVTVLWPTTTTVDIVTAPMHCEIFNYQNQQIKPGSRVTTSDAPLFIVCPFQPERR